MKYVPLFIPKTSRPVPSADKSNMIVRTVLKQKIIVYVLNVKKRIRRKILEKERVKERSKSRRNEIKMNIQRRNVASG
jgi:hypothetical protein